MSVRRLLVVVTAGMCLSGTAYGQKSVQADVEAIERILKENTEAWRQSDARTIVKYDHPDFTGFYWEGGLLHEGKFEPAALQAQFDAGMKLIIDGTHHQKVSVYGNTAVVTRYLTVTHAAPGNDGEMESLALRTTVVMAKIDGKWSWVHDHISSLTIPPSQ